MELIAKNPRFELGQIVATPGALDLLKRMDVTPFSLLKRHVSGDWGDLCAEDKEANNIAVRQGDLRVFSAYNLASYDGTTNGRDAVRVWIITEADRSVTTFLLPSEY